MLNSLKKNKFKILISILVVVGFALLRAFERKLFYDPFIVYFEADFNSLPYPEVQTLKLFWSLFLRYFLNSALSILLIYFLFPDRDIFKFILIVYACFLMVLLSSFYIILNFFPDGAWLLFYVRRFIIQPLLVLLFIPGFYYQLQKIKK